MSRYIDADALKKKIRRDYHPMDEIPFFEIMHIISDAPTVEERPKGEWIEVDVHNCYATLECSVCDRVIEPTFAFGEYSYEDIKTFYPYCHCGADMRGEE